LSLFTKLFGKGKKKLNLQVTKVGEKESESKPKDTGTTLRKPEESPAPPQKKEGPELTALEMAHRKDWEVKTLPTWKPGDVIMDTYEVEDMIPGGMGHVYIAYHKKWNVKVAIKSPNEMMLSDRNFFARILREANSWIELGLHPNIAYCYYVRNIEDVPHIVVEYVDGGNLKQWIEDGKCIDYRTNLDLAIQFCHGMEYAHSKGMIHRDIKPANVLMTKEGILKITDFGLVRTESSNLTQQNLEKHEINPDNPNLTQLGTFMGTPGYMAPEQAESASNVDERADIFSFGVCLYEMFCGNKPYEITYGPKQKAPDPKELSGAKDFPMDIASVLTKTIQWDREERYTSFNEIRQDLIQRYQRLFKEKSPYAEQEVIDLKADGLNNRALSYLELGKEEEAIRSFEDALKEDPHHLEATFNYGYFRWHKSEPYQDVLETPMVNLETTHSSNPDYWRFLAWTHLERGEIDALEKIQQSDQAVTDLEFLKAYAAPNKPVGRLVWSPQGHTSPIISVAFSPDGRFALSGGGDITSGGMGKKNLILLWEIETGKEIRRFEGHKGCVTSVAFSPDGRHAISGSCDETLRLWEVETGKEIRCFSGHARAVNSVTFSPDGHYALSGSGDKTVRLWEISTGKEIRRFELAESASFLPKDGPALAFSPDGRSALSGYTNIVHIWEINTGKEMRRFEVHNGCVTSGAFSSGGRYILFEGGFDQPIRLWDVITGKEFLDFKGHTGSVNSFAFSADGIYALSGGSDKTVRLWEVKTGKKLQCFEGHTRTVNSVVFSNDNRYALSGSDDWTLRLWEIETGKELRCFKGATGSVNAIFSPDGRYALLEKGKTILLWEIATKKEIMWFKGHTDKILSVDFSPDGRYALSGSRDTTLRLWEVNTGREVRSFEGHTDIILSVDFSPDGRYALSGSRDTTLRLWEVNTGYEVRRFAGHTDCILSAAFSPDGRYVLSGSSDKTLRLWEVETGREVWRLVGRAEVSSVSFSPDGRYVLLGKNIFGEPDEKNISLLEIETGKEIRNFEGHDHNVNSVVFSPDGRYALTGGFDKTLRLWEVETGREVRRFEGHEDHVESVSFSPDGRYALSGSDDNTFRLWEIFFSLKGKEHNQIYPILCTVKDFRQLSDEKKGVQSLLDSAIYSMQKGLFQKAYNLLREAQSIPGYERNMEVMEFLALCGIRGKAERVGLKGAWCSRVYEGHTGEVCSVDLSPDSRYALSGGGYKNDFTLRLWDIETGEEIRQFKHAGYVQSVAFSPDGRFAFSGEGIMEFRDEKPAIHVWEIDTGKEIQRFEGHIKGVESIMVSPDGQQVLSGSRDYTLRLWDIETGKEIRCFKGHKESVYSVSFSPNGRFALSWSEDLTLRLWEIKTGEEIRCFKGHSGFVQSVAVSPDGRYALSGSRDHSVRLWEIDTGEEIRCIKGSTSMVHSVAFSPGGRYALSGGDYNNLRLWEIETGREIRYFEGHTGTITSLTFSQDSHYALSGSTDRTLRLWEFDWEWKFD